MTQGSTHRLAGRNIAGTCTVTQENYDEMKLRAQVSSDERYINEGGSHTPSDAQNKMQERKRIMMEDGDGIRVRREQATLKMDIEQLWKAPLVDEDVTMHQHVASIRRIQSLAMQAQGYADCDKLCKQYKENQAREARYNKSHDDRMEQERYKELNRCNKAREEKRFEALEARNALEDQINERQKKKIWEEEAKALEGSRVLQMYKKYEAEEKMKVEKQRDSIKKNLVQIRQTNERLQSHKAAEIDRKKYEEGMMRAFLRRKASEDEARRKEKLELDKLKEQQFAKLCAKQQKTSDTRSFEDEIRAKRAYEAMEMRLRRKEDLQKIELRKAIQRVSDDRTEQIQLRQALRNKEKDAETKLNKLSMEMEKEAVQKQVDSMEIHRHRQMAYREQLEEQIRNNALSRNQTKQIDAVNATYRQKKQTKECIIAEKVRQETLEKLRKQNVPEIYLLELKRMTISQSDT